MNYLLVCKLQSVILAALTVALGLSALVAGFLDDPLLHPHAREGFILSALVAACGSGALFLFGRKSRDVVFPREALAVIGLGWISASLFGALPYYLILDISFASAIFESTSGLTTTGASVLSRLESLPPSLLFWRSISQWIGGLGVVVFFVTVLAFLGAGAKALFTNESSVQATELDSARVQRGIVRLILLYLALSAASFGSLLAAGMGWFDALNHAFTTVSTGGFSTRSGSISDFGSPLIEWVLIFFMAIGGTSFIVMLRFAKGDWRAFNHSSEVKLYYSLILGASIVVGLILWRQVGGPFAESFHETLRRSAFQVVSIVTTSGFATEDYGLWPPAILHLFLALMVIGGCAGSTSGGSKVFRLLIAAKLSFQQVEKAYRPHVVRPLRVNGENLSREAQESTLVFYLIAGALTIASVVLIAFLEPGLSLSSSLSAGVASIFNIGPGFDQIGPMANFAELHDASKLLLSLLMIVGRVELFPILVLFAPGLWKQF